MVSPEKKFLVAVGRAEERETCRQTLQDAGYAGVTLVDNGQDALGVLGAGGPLVTIAAWELPGLGGLRLVREIRKKPAITPEPCAADCPGIRWK